MTRLLSLALGSLAILAVASGQTVEITKNSGDSTGGRSKDASTKDEDGKILYSGRPLEAWVADLKDDDALIRDEAVEVLAQLGRRARSALADLRKLLKAGDPDLRIRAALAVWKVGGDSTGVPEVLAEGMKDASSAMKREALVALGAIGPDAAVATNAIVLCLDDPDATLRNQAANTLQQLGRAARPALFASLKGESPTVRQNVLVQLGTYMAAHLDKGDIPALTARLGDDTPRCRVEAARILWAMGRTGAPVVAALLEGVEAPGGDLQAIILQTLQGSTDKPKSLLPLLEVCLRGDNVHTRIQAARVLLEVEKKPERVLPIYLAVLADSTNQSQGHWNYAISALVELKADARPALPRLIELVKTPNYYSHDLNLVLTNIGTPAVGPLLEILQSTTLPVGSYSYETAVVALGTLGPPAAKAVLPLLSSRDATIRIRAIRVVSALGTHAKDAVPKLVEAIHDPSVRAAALQALGNLGGLARPAVPRLIELAKDRDFNLRLLSLQTLASIRPDAKEVVPLCLPLLRDPNASVRQAALQLLAAVAPEHRAILPATLKFLDDPDTRVAALHVIGAMGPAGAKAVPQIAKLLDDPHEDPKQRALYTLSQIGPAAKSAAPALFALLASSDANTVQAAANALRNIEPDAKSSLPKLIAFLEKSKDYSAVPILALLAEYGQAARTAFPTVLAILEDPTRLPQVRATAAFALSRISPARAKKEALPPMRKLLALPDQRLTVAEAIFQTDDTDKEAIAVFESQLGRAVPSVRGSVCDVLGRIGPPAKRFLPKIREQCKDEDVYLRSSAAMAAYRITKDAKEALPTLGAILENPKLQYSKTYAADYLGEMGIGAIPLLTKLRTLRSSGDAYTRSRMASAVYKIE